MARILIVDDSPSQLMGIRRIVEKLGHEALTAEDGAAGVEAAKREIPDLILMDVVMPNLNAVSYTQLDVYKRQGVTRLEVVANMHERKARMFDLADAFVALPGGFGTLDEMFEMLTWRQLGLGRNRPRSP